MFNQLTNKACVKTLLATSITVATLSLAGCSANASNYDDGEYDRNTEYGESNGVVIYKNGAIYTVNPEQPWAEAMVIKDGVITYVGSDANVEEFEMGDVKVVDLDGKMVMPGFHDVHIHALESGSDNNHFELEIEETDPEKYISVIKQAAKDFPDTEWLIGYGHDLHTLLEAERNPVEILDEAVSDRPVIIMEHTSHSMWVNSKALELAGFDQHTDNPIGGVIMRDEETGKPNGLLMDNAGEIVMNIAMAPNTQAMQNDYDGLVDYTLPELAKHGITSIADARAYWKRGYHKTWQKAEQNDDLTARVVLGLWAYPEENDEVQLEMLKSLYTNDQDSLLRINQIKLYSDGITSNTTAALHDPYEIDLLGIDGNKGLNYFTEQRLSNYIAELEEVGFDFHIHGIGERGIHEALNAVEESGSKQGRHRITHVEMVNPQDLPRFAELNVTADAQVAGGFTHPHHWSEHSELVGHEKSDNLIPLRSLADADARITLSSDWSVSPYNPFIGLQNAVTRYPQNLTLSEAIAAYTLDAAYVMRQEQLVGSIEVGKEADIIVLSQNVFEISPQSINQTKVLQTLLAGEEIYRSAQFDKR
ncbi:amidohydrolase family protein [Vibrio sp. Of7-15]|uniref:amidohydrolase n=1 Tax=Vibrio sp. Of7-15 TaxID=2724879 RepID=UPI001EF2AC24|nr:amidohydrolase [Vibrio sp. Of7-15]MCG7499442.1 amidohydrolase family protein [Vibrio sp. Of7-15]